MVTMNCIKSKTYLIHRENSQRKATAQIGAINKLFNEMRALDGAGMACLHLRMGMVPVDHQKLFPDSGS